MWQQFKSLYLDGWRAAALFPLLFIIPAIVEFAQHIVEMQSGMYHSIAAAKAAENDSLRMAFGFAKTLALGLPGYWFIRFLAFRDPVRAARIESPAFGLWLVLYLLQAVGLAYGLFGPPLGTALGLAASAEKWAGPIAGTAWSLVGVYLTAWIVAWPLGNREVGPVQSVRIMTGSFWRTIGYMIGGVLPLMVVHYGLGYLAIAVTPDWLDWPVLVIDALIVAWLACTMAGSSYLAALHAAARKGVALVNEPHA